MFTNAYPPHVGGVADAVSQAVKKLKQKGHSVLVVAPGYEGMSEDTDVVRLQSMKNISGSDFSLPFPFSIELGEEIGRFSPDIIHSHYPFLVGDMALRYGALKHIPVVFTHHTRYEAYENLLPWDIEGFDSFVTQLSTGYANLCNRVIVPTAGMVGLLKSNGVKTPLEIIPTGVDIHQLSTGDGGTFRRENGIAPDAFVVGYTGRLAPEKNLDFWAEAVCEFLEKHPAAHALVVGGGECASNIKETFARRGLAGRLSMTGVLRARPLVDAYHAMDIFAFTSIRETQGIVLVEALAAGCPVVALDARCVRDVVSDGTDGHLVKSHETRLFCKALDEFAKMRESQYKHICDNARKNARRFDIDTCLKKTLQLYSELISDRRPDVMEVTGWLALGELGRSEMMLWKNRISALLKALGGVKQLKP